MHDFEPKIVMFVCNWCSYAGADKAGIQKLDYSSNIKLIRMMCSGRVDPQFVMDAFKKGADGVMVLGCHPGDCHYRSGNMNAFKRFKIFEKMMGQLGIDEKRIKIDWVGAGEADRFQKIANEMTEAVRELGPLDLR